MGVIRPHFSLMEVVRLNPKAIGEDDRKWVPRLCQTMFCERNLGQWQS
jgi:hypothetical protein